MIASMTALGRLGDPEELEGIIQLLASYSLGRPFRSTVACPPRCGPPGRPGASSVSESLVSEEPDFRRQLFGACCGLLFTAGLAVGWFGLAHGYLPAKASLTAEQTAQFFGDHHLGILLGCTIWLSAVALLTVWSAQMGLTLGRLEGPWPLLAITQALCGGAQSGLMLTWPLLTVQMITTSLRGAEGPQHEPGLPALAVPGVDRRGDRHGRIGRAGIHEVGNLLVSRPSRVLRAGRALGPLGRRPLGVHDQAHPPSAGRRPPSGSHGVTLIDLGRAWAWARRVMRQHVSVGGSIRMSKRALSSASIVTTPMP
jgi:hypothetical protein